MKPEKILLPLDIAKCPLEVFPLVNSVADRCQLSIILLHVINLKIVLPESRPYEELACETHAYLRRIAQRYLVAHALVETRVRFGIPAEEVLAEARAEQVNMILLPNFGPSFWQRLKFVWKRSSNPLVSSLVQEVMRKAECDVFIAMARNCFDSERGWGRISSNEPRPDVSTRRSVWPYPIESAVLSSVCLRRDRFQNAKPRHSHYR
jgi:nucleotide-binding universal stress UspA family protein